MKWNRYKIKVKEEHEELVTCTLAEAGVQGVEIVDAIPLTEQEIGQMFVDIPPAPAESDGSATLCFYLDPASEETPAILARVREGLDELRAFCDIGEAAIEEDETEDADWENEWKKYFRPFRIDDIYVTPSWADQEDPSASSVVTLRIDPGTAFGTGMHETTQLCIRQMREKLSPAARILDIGTGSGILGILALQFGAASVTGTDLDPNAEPAVRENCENNGVRPEDFVFLLGDIGGDPAVQEAVGEACYDLVLTNILADVLVKLAPAAARALKSGGYWITSGILAGQEMRVIEAAERAGLIVEELTQQGEWMSVTARKQEMTE